MDLYLILGKSQRMTEKSTLPAVLELRAINQGANDREEK